MGAVKNSGVFKGVSAKGQIAKGLAKAGIVFYRQYDSATLAVIDSANSKGYALPTNLTPLDNLIKNLKTISSGAFWNSRDSIHLSAIIGNSTTHHGLRKLNLKNPAGQERIFYGGLSLFNSYGGIQGNGTNAYIDHVTPLNSYANYKQNDAGIIVVKSLDVAAILTSKATSDVNLNVLVRGNNGAQRINSLDGINSVNTAGIGAIGLSRISSSIQSIYNKAAKTDVNVNSVVVSDQSIWEFRNQSTTTAYYSGDELCVIVGASYTQVELNLFRTYFNQYLTESGFTAIA